jgi:hypothetical protein
MPGPNLQSQILERLQALALSRGGSCLSDQFVSDKTKLRWKCANGHEWEAVPYSVRAGTWCPYCAKKKVDPALRIADMHLVAEQRGGKCHATTYDGPNVKSLWTCSRGHQWRAVGREVIKGKWCPQCAGRLGKEDGLAQMRAAAQQRGGECLATEYKSVTTLVYWRCSQGHEWRATYESIRNGSWCRICAGVAKRPFTSLSDLATSYGGVCLSNSYSTYLDDLKWRCKKGHEWISNINSILNGHWCPMCHWVRAKRTILLAPSAAAYAAERGGSCLTPNYNDIEDRVVMRCGRGHEFAGKVSSFLIMGQWCYYCARDPTLRLQQANELAAKRGGLCLSAPADYKTLLTHLRWQCWHGHRWSTALSSILEGHWCPVCAGNAPKSSRHRIGRERKLA